MLEKIKQAIINWGENVNEYWSAGCRFRAVFTFIVPPVLVALIIILLFSGMSAVFNFLYNHATQLVMAALAVWAFLAWWDKHKADNIETERKAQEIRERQKYTDQCETVQTQNETYVAQGKIVFTIAPELGALGIVPPATLSNIYSPGRMIPKANGTVSLSLFLLQKDRETVDTDLLKHILQTKADQRLQAGEFPGVPEHHIFRGKAYSGFVIDTVRDSTGGFVEVYTAFVDDAYCRYHENRELNKYRLLPSVDRRDTDY